VAETDAAVTVLACGERWHDTSEDGELRFALEDYLGAGAIITCLPPDISRSPEALAASKAFQGLMPDLEAALLGCGSGIELADKGYRDDVLHAARRDQYEVAPVLMDGERFEDDLPIILATRGDVQTIVALLDGAARWLEAQGIFQWQPGVFGARVAEGVAQGECYVARRAGQTVGTFQLRASDPVIWGAAGDDGTAIYVHSLAVADNAHGQGIGRFLLRHAERLAVQRGKSRLRLDCWAGNARLRAYYEAAGFAFVREASEVTWSCALFEKQVQDR
jgi:ribosomal protein S18 acetylase RimI-like enzyme